MLSTGKRDTERTKAAHQASKNRAKRAIQVRPLDFYQQDTTNDNLCALHFYQKRGFRLVTVHRNALDAARQLKPRIPLIGNDQFPLHDEIELEMMLEQ